MTDWEARARVAEEDYATLLRRWKEEQRLRLAAEAEVVRLTKAFNEVLDGNMLPVFAPDRPEDGA